MDTSTILEEIARIIEVADNYLAAAGLSVSAEIHVRGLRAGMNEIRDDLLQIYLDNGGEDVWAGYHG